MAPKSVLHSLVHVPSDKDSVTIYSKPYALGSHFKIDRDGLYFSIFNQMYDNEYSNTPHVLTAKFEAFNKQEMFYKIHSKQDAALDKINSIILLFHLNPLESSLDLMTDFLMHLKKLKIEAKMLAHYHYSLDLNKASDQLYPTSFYKLLQETLGVIPEPVTPMQIEKQSSFLNTLVVESSQWKSVDNYLVHVILSKGGGILQPRHEDVFEMKNEEWLSPFHSIQLVKRKIPVESRCEFYDELRGRDFFKNPQEMKIFYQLIYKNIFESYK